MVELVHLSRGGGTAVVNPAREVAGTGVLARDEVTSAALPAGADVSLRMTVDPAAGAVSGHHRLGEGAWTALPRSVPLDPALLDDPATRAVEASAGLSASRRLDTRPGPVTCSFSQWSLRTASDQPPPPPPPPAAVAVDVSFPSATKVPPPGWLRDSGEAYGLRTGPYQGSGPTHGWVARGTAEPLSLVGDGRDRTVGSGAVRPTDPRLGSLVHVQLPPGVAGGNPAPGSFELAVPPGAQSPRTPAPTPAPGPVATCTWRPWPRTTPATRGSPTLLRPVTPTTPPQLGAPAEAIANDVVGGGAPAPVVLANTGGSPLTLSALVLSGAGAARSATGAPALPASIPPGAGPSVPVTSAAGVVAATLTVTSDDPAALSTAVALRRLVTSGTAGTSGTGEPSPQRVVDVLGLPLDVGDPDPATTALGSATPLGQEVPLQAMVAATRGRPPRTRPGLPAPVRAGRRAEPAAGRGRPRVEHRGPGLVIGPRRAGPSCGG